MRIPATINKNTLIAYSGPAQRTTKGNLQSYNLQWSDNKIPKCLRDFCIEAIASRWEENPILEELKVIDDRCFLLEKLPTTLPLPLTVLKINEDVYWKKCFLEKWPKLIPKNVPKEIHITDENSAKNHSRRQSTNNFKSKRSSQEKRTWKECFVEMHAREYLEKLKPEEYNPEEIKKLCDLTGQYVKFLNIRELQCSETSSSRVPLNSVLTGFQNLSEISLCFNQTYVGEGFSWNILRLPLPDVKLLAKGLEKCKLKVFRVSNSDIDDEKVRIILRSLLKHEDLHLLEFSHCKISDKGAMALTQFSLKNPVKEYILSNNRIGSIGMEALSYAICQSCCNLSTMNLKLNPISVVGAEFLINALTRGARGLKNLSVNGCGLGSDNGSLGEMVEYNSIMEYLDLSNNALGDDIGESILNALSYNKSLTKLDVRMCNLSPELEFALAKKTENNRRMKNKLRKPLIREPSFDYPISVDLLQQLEDSLQQ